MPFFWLGLTAVIGVVISDAVKQTWWLWAAAGAACLIVFGRQVVRRYQPQARRLPLALTLFIFCLSGMLYALSLQPDTPGYIHHYLERGELEISGVVSAPPKQQLNNLAVLLDVKTVRMLEDGASITSKPVKGKLLLRLPKTAAWQYGDLLSVKGKLAEPSNGSDFSYRDYLKHQNVYAMLYYPRVSLVARECGNPLRAWIYNLSERGKAVIDHLFAVPESSLLKGILLGDQNGIPADLKRAYALTGTSHIIAISGFNMAILAGVVSRLTRRMNVVPAGALTILVLAFYTVLVGASASVIRAAVMGSYSILGRFIGRKGNLLNSLGVCVLAMVLLDPHAPWDIGFQLSVMATLGLSLYTSPLQARLNVWIRKRAGEAAAEKWTPWIADTFLVTLIAQASVLPLLLYHFREFSPLFLLANPLILPFQPAVMQLGLATLLLGMIWLPLGNLTRWLAWLPTAYTNWMVSSLAKWLPNGFVMPRVDALWVLLFYLLTAWLTLRPTRRGQLRPVFQPVPAFLGLLLAAIVVWMSILNPPDGRLHVRFFGESKTPTSLIISPGGGTILINGAKSPGNLADDLIEALPPFSHYLNAIIIPLCKQDEVKGLMDLDARLAIGTVYWGCDYQRIQTTQRLYNSFEAAHIRQIAINDDEYLKIGQTGNLKFVRSGEHTQLLRLITPQTEVLWSFDKAIKAGGGREFFVGEQTLTMPESVLSNMQRAILEDHVSTKAFNDQNLSNMLDFRSSEWLEIIIGDKFCQLIIK